MIALLLGNICSLFEGKRNTGLIHLGEDMEGVHVSWTEGAAVKSVDLVC